MLLGTSEQPRRHGVSPRKSTLGAALLYGPSSGVTRPRDRGRAVQFRAGDRVNHYTLIEPLGEGGQGSVWKVVDPRDGGVVRALKLVSLVGARPAVFERVVREARILASATHPALVTCHSFFEETREGVVGLLMDLVPGRFFCSRSAASRRTTVQRGGSEEELSQAVCPPYARLSDAE
jgi:serine/threonine protein kinase